MRVVQPLRQHSLPGILSSVCYGGVLRQSVCVQWPIDVITSAGRLVWGPVRRASWPILYVVFLGMSTLPHIECEIFEVGSVVCVLALFCVRVSSWREVSSSTLFGGLSVLQVFITFSTDGSVIASGFVARATPVCAAGYFAYQGIAPCSPCSPGLYASGVATSSCSACFAG